MQLRDSTCHGPVAAEDHWAPSVPNQAAGTVPDPTSGTCVDAWGPPTAYSPKLGIFMYRLHRSATPIVVVVGLMAFTGCGSGSDSQPPRTEATADTAPSTVTLEVGVEQETEGQSARVRATMQVGNLRITPAGDTVSGTGHHHLYLDTELTPVGQPVPSIPGQVVHLGDGSAEYVFEGIAPGNHRMIAVVADGLHMPLQPWVVDTVDFVIR